MRGRFLTPASTGRRAASTTWTIHKCMISMSACREDAERVRGLVEGAFPALAGKVEINDIGTVIGSHTGPGTVVLFFMGDEREE